MFPGGRAKEQKLTRNKEAGDGEDILDELSYGYFHPALTFAMSME